MPKEHPASDSVRECVMSLTSTMSSLAFLSGCSTKKKDSMSPFQQKEL